MDESQSLDALANLMNDIAENPFDLPTHFQHIRLAESFLGMEAEAMSAREMMSQFLAVGEDIWLPLLDAKEASLDLETREGVSEMLALYEGGEADYLSIPILEKHLKFIIERHDHYASSENGRPENLGEMFTIDWTREALSQIVTKGVIHLTESYRLWDLWKDWELKVLENASPAERPLLVEHVHDMFLLRVCQVHSKMEDTFQAYSSFATNYLPPKNYEKLLVSASKTRGQSVRNWEWREPQESKLEKSGRSLQAFHEYALYERRAKKPDLFVIRGIYERAITEAANQRHKGEAGVEEALQLFWWEYCDALRLLDASFDERREAFRRAIRSVPGSGEVWARYIRFLERIPSSGEQYDSMETVADVFERALAMKIVQKDANQLVSLILARAGYEKRQLDESNEDDDALPTLIELLERGISMSRQASNLIDQSLRLEKFLASVYEHYGLIDNVFDVWKDAAQYSKSSYQVWFNYTEALIKHKKYEEARQVFMNLHADKRIDWPEAIWDAWMSFEHMHGSLTDIENCMTKVEKAQQQTNARRAKEAEKATYQTMQATVAAQVDNAAVPAVANVSSANVEDVPMQIDPPKPHGTKRGVEEEDPEANKHKKARMEQKPPPLKRDRENCEVFVGDLPVGVTEDDLLKLFKDCGSVREIKITHLPSGSVATVEFTDRDSVPAALTKDKKRLEEQEISVHLAWKSTLYITNFPETANDKFIRDLFGKYGEIFDVRWPSKKFKSTRRFCYVQYTTTDAAKDALQLHRRELEPNLPLNVFMSNPERKKERTDVDANQKEVYVAGLSKYTTKADLEKVFSTYGTLKDVRIALDDSGHAKGYAFVEYDEASDASRALGANNYELKKRRIAVTLADIRIRARHKSDIGLSRVAEARTRSVYISNLPPATQEGLLQQVLESIAPVKRVEVFLDKQEAVVQLENQSDVGRLLLRSEPIVFGGNPLNISEDMPSSRANKDRVASFKPRNLGPSRPKAGLGFKSTPKPSTSVPSSGGKGQDDFRKMLERK